jgi:prepilin-type processing-associated H-X9-DG protein
MSTAATARVWTASVFRLPTRSSSRTARGTRFYDGGLRIIDFDCSPTSPSPTSFQFGSFTASGPIFHGSAEYGRTHNTALAPDNYKLSARHTNLLMNCGYFDGHVGAMKLSQAWTDPVPWFPGNSTFNGGSATPESIAFMAQRGSNVIP